MVHLLMLGWIASIFNCESDPRSPLEAGSVVDLLSSVEHSWQNTAIQSHAMIQNAPYTI